jgi:hypothetical protein
VRILDEVQQARSSSKNDRGFLNLDGSPPHENSLTRFRRTAVKAVGFDPKPTVHDRCHCWHTNSARSGVHPAIADAILGHGDKKKSLQSLYMTISDHDLVRAIDMMRLDVGETRIWVKK